MKKSAKKQSLNEMLEEIEVLGQDDEDKAVKWVQEVGKRDEKEARKEHDDTLTRLNDKKKHLTYSEILVEETRYHMSRVDIPQGFRWNCYKTDKGIAFFVKTPDGRIFVRGNTISLIPEIDMNGSLGKIQEMLDFMDRIEDEMIAKKQASKNDTIKKE